nr:alpha/beta fold hydrolase [Rhodococcus opacus]
MSLIQNSEPEIFGEPAGADAAPLTVVGRGSPVVFLHGWGLTPRVYGHSLSMLAQQGHRVVTPTLPGFGGTPDHPPEARTFAGYAAWLGRFLDDAGISEPVTLVGHSFGGGVAIQTAHDLPERVARLVLVNSVGGGAWSSDGWGIRPIGERPLWDWGASALGEALSIRTIAHTTASLVNGFLPNTLRDPGGGVAHGTPGQTGGPAPRTRRPRRPGPTCVPRLGSRGPDDSSRQFRVDAEGTPQSARPHRDRRSRLADPRPDVLRRRRPPVTPQPVSG